MSLVDAERGFDGPHHRDQARADVDYFTAVVDRRFDDEETTALRETVLKAYRWQYIVSGVQHPRFAAILGELITAAQGKRIGTALAPIL